MKGAKRTKVLVVDDSRLVASMVAKDPSGIFEICCTSKADESDMREREDLASIERCLRTVPYAAILMDGDLGMRLSEREGYSGLRHACDGQVILSGIIGGDYGSVNQKTPVYSISSAYELQGQRGLLGKLDDERHIARVAKMLKEQYGL